MKVLSRLSMTGSVPTPLPFREWLRQCSPGLFAPGHVATDFLAADDWRVLREELGILHLEIPLPDQVRNPRGVLFGGFAATYIDVAAIATLEAGRSSGERDAFAITVNMRVDYFEPLSGDRFEIESRVVKSRRRSHFVESRFMAPDVGLAIFAFTTLRDTPS